MASSSENPLLQPDAESPFVFLWDEKAGGSTFNRWLLESAARAKVLQHGTQISDFWFPNVIGAPYFLKLFGEERRRKLAILSGTLDWRAVEGMCLPSAAGPFQFPSAAAAEEEVPLRFPRRRQVHCFVLLRDPVDRFISYWLERSNRKLEDEDGAAWRMCPAGNSRRIWIRSGRKRWLKA